MSEQVWPVQPVSTAPRTMGVDVDREPRPCGSAGPRSSCPSWPRRLLLASVPSMSGAPSSGAMPGLMPAPAPSIVSTDIGQR